MLARPAFRTLIPALVMVALVACGGSTSSPSAASSAPTASPSAKAITKVEMARSLAKDGSAESPIVSFDSATDQQLIAVLTLANLS